VPWSKERNIHPTQKPLQIAERILDVFSNSGSVILDCYTGSAYCGFGCHLEKESRFERLKEREPKRYEQMMKLTNNGVSYKTAIQTVLKKPKYGGAIF
jgi:hypothetical protein